jgi:hypothetical protein
LCAVDVAGIKPNELPLETRGSEPSCVLFKFWTVGKLKNPSRKFNERKQKIKGYEGVLGGYNFYK